MKGFRISYIIPNIINNVVIFRIIKAGIVETKNMIFFIKSIRSNW